MTEIPFTQYLRPDGRPTRVSIEVGDEVAVAAALLLARGYRFECEVLTTDHVSFTVVGPDKEGETTDLTFEIVPNGALVPAAVDRLILNFRRKLESEKTGEQR